MARCSHMKLGRFESDSSERSQIGQLIWNLSETGLMLGVQFINDYNYFLFYGCRELDMYWCISGCGNIYKYVYVSRYMLYVKKKRERLKQFTPLPPTWQISKTTEGLNNDTARPWKNGGLRNEREKKQEMTEHFCFFEVLGAYNERSEWVRKWSQLEIRSESRAVGEGIC